MVLRKTLPIRKTLRQTFQVRTSRTSTLKALSTEKKWVLHSIKAAFAFSWAFGNAICYFLTGRFFTMLTGNVLILAVEVSQWNTEEMMFTAALIALFVLGSALYDGVSFWLKDEDKVVKRFVAPFLLTLGILSDVIQFATGGCSSGTSGDGCKGSDLYFLTPMASLAAIVTEYLVAHPDGITTHFITYHSQNVPRIALRRLMKGKRGEGEKAWVSFFVITSFFLGSLAGVFASEGILVRYNTGSLTPVFTCFSAVMVCLTLMHFTLCEQFCYDCQKEEEVIEKVRATMNAQSGNDRRKTTVKDMMMMVVAKVDKDEDNDQLPRTYQEALPSDGKVDDLGELGEALSLADEELEEEKEDSDIFDDNVAP